MGRGTQIVIINGTPHQWTQQSAGTPYQMNSWDPPANVPANSMVNFYAEWDEGIFTTSSDDAANLEYSIDDTNSSFTIRARFDSGPRVEIYLSGMSTVNNSSGDTIDLGFTWNGLDYPFYNSTVVMMSGVEGSFVCNGASNQLTQSWLQGNLKYWGQLNLRQLCLPATHDSGMSTIGFSTAFANSDNCQTQTNDIAAQLGYGVRFFDIRPVISHGDYYTGHYSNTSSILGWQGADGQKISDVVNQINSFTTNHPELVVLELSHAYDTDGNYSDFTQTQWDGLFTQLAQLNHLYIAPANTTDLTQLKLSQFIGQGQAAVVLYVDFDSESLSLGDYAGQGFYYKSQFPIYDSYANTDDPNTLISNQFGELSTQRNAGDSTVFSLDWNLTQQGAETVFGASIRDMAKEMNAWLAPTVMQKCSATQYPNLLSMDNVVDTTGLAVAAAINSLAATALPTARISDLRVSPKAGDVAVAPAVAAAS